MTQETPSHDSEEKYLQSCFTHLFAWFISMVYSGKKHGQEYDQFEL